MLLFRNQKIIVIVIIKYFKEISGFLLQRICQLIENCFVSINFYKIRETQLHQRYEQIKDHPIEIITFVIDNKSEKVDSFLIILYEHF